jgi:hypothetical protein
MNRFVKRRSRLFLILGWGFAATLFADAANLDDLFSSNYVIHDDDAASVPPWAMPSHDGAAPQTPAKSPPSPVRLILDQDSPSLAADSETATLTFQAMPSVEEAAGYVHVITADALHIRLRTLLI